MKQSVAARLALVLCSLALQSCGGGGGSEPAPTFVVTVTVAGLTTSGLTLSSGPEVLPVSAGAATASFQGRLVSGTTYSVAVKTQPAERDEVCVIVGSTGVVASSNPVVAISCHATQWLVTTVAGSSLTGSADGAPTAATFAQPSGVAVAADGTLFVADSGNNKIRKIAGVVSTLAGTGAVGYADGPGVSAMFNVPQGVAVDSTGTVFVADGTNCMVRAVRADGVTSTHAGRSGGCFQYPPADGGGATASFNNPTALALAADGNLFVADTYNNAIRQVTSAGVVSSLWAPGSVFADIRGVAVDAAGIIYFPDGNGGKIYRVSTAGVLSVLAGSGDAGFQDGQGVAASFVSPRSVAIDAGGNVFIGDGSATIRKIAPGGRVTTIAGQPFATGFDDGNGSVARFGLIASLATDLAGNIYVADLVNNRIRKISAL